jgi:hypothetical protein
LRCCGRELIAPSSCLHDPKQKSGETAANTGQQRDFLFGPDKTTTSWVEAGIGSAKSSVVSKSKPAHQRDRLRQRLW